jgi:hypothetical protein
MAGDDCQPQLVRQPLSVDLAVGGKREHRLDELLEPQGGGDLAHEVRGLVADVAEPVGRPRRHEHPVAGLRDERPLAEPELQLPGEHLEALLLRRMDMGCGDGAVRLDERLDDDALAVRVG